MKRKIRYKVFETNSSSQHSLIYKSDGRKPSELEKDGDALVIHVGDFTPEKCNKLWTQKEKVGYLFTYKIVRDNLQELPTKMIMKMLREDEQWSQIEKYLMDYTNSWDIKIVKDEPPKMSSIFDATFAEEVYEYGWWVKDDVLDFVFDNSRGIDLSYD